ncbi:GIN domain-containing protein [Flavobacterium sp.]|uniref:GIN domain-containing protein n=1 Tax=Flavobacterium sp. TaxID=239 RepID=UPI003750A8C1
MKKSILLLALVLISSSAFSQKKEKVKGSKIVTTEIKKIENFEALEVLDNLEVFLVKGTQCGLEIEADDNLHDAIDIVLNGSTLKLSTLKSAFGYKKLSIRITYTDDFKSVIARNEASITALANVELDSVTFKSYDESNLFLNSKSKNITILMDDKSKAELNSKAEKTNITLSKNAKLKALITSKELTFDMYQKTDAVVEGDIDSLKLRLDNNAAFEGKKLITKTAELTAELYSKVSILVDTSIIIEASGKSEIQLFGDQKIELKRFVDSAILMKKPTK